MFRKDFYRDLCQQNLRLENSLCQKNEKIATEAKNAILYDDVRKIEFYNHRKHGKVEEIKDSHIICSLPKELKAQVAVIFQDSVDCAFFLQKQGYNPLLLNMASDTTPGGGWRNGALAQEECLFYRSLYHLSLESKKEVYPLTNYACIYSPNVYFFRCGQKVNHELTPSAVRPWDILDDKDRRFISCIAMPALRRPELTEEGMLTKEDEEITKEKLHGIMKVALIHGHDTVILGAMGCGAFRNPPKHIAKIVHEIIYQYSDCFKKIVIPILDYNGSNNFEIFREEMSKEDEVLWGRAIASEHRPRIRFCLQNREFLARCHFPECFSDEENETENDNMTAEEQEDYNSALRAIELTRKGIWGSEEKIKEPEK